MEVFYRFKKKAMFVIGGALLVFNVLVFIQQ